MSKLIGADEELLLVANETTATETFLAVDENTYETLSGCDWEKELGEAVEPFPVTATDEEQGDIIVEGVRKLAGKYGVDVPRVRVLDVECHWFESGFVR